MTVPLADYAPMAPLLAAFKRGTRRSRLRQLVVVCQAGHTLIEVFPTASGPVAVWRHMTAWAMVDGQAALARQLDWLAAPLSEIVDGETGVGEVGYLEDSAACRCTEQAAVDGRALLEWLDAGTRRAVTTT